MSTLLEQGRLPTLARLAACGRLNLDCISIFPSITPAATSTIVTGHYPREHGVAGMSWFDPDTGAVSYFGDDVWTVARRGFGDLLRGFLLRLNDETLKAKTIFQLTEEQGCPAGCFNHLIFKGNTPHEVRVPLLMRLLPSVDSKLVVHGPSTLCLGDFVSERRHRRAPKTNTSVFHRFGLDDDGTAGFLLDLDGVKDLPRFSVAYFANNDFDSHSRGPENAAETLDHVDELLGQVIDAWGGFDRVLDDLCLMLTADHSQSDVVDGADAAIDLGPLLDRWTLADPASGWRDGDEAMICPNMRAAELYVREPTLQKVREMIRCLLRDARVDQVLWRDPSDPKGPYRVTTADRGELAVAADGAGEVSDAYGGRWRCQGDLSALDARVTATGEVEYGTYPNAFERIAGGLGQEQGGKLWVTARPGHEFEVTGQKPHRGGGSHGTLHELDSVVPLLIAGDRDGLDVPAPPRLVDVTPLCLQALGLHSILVPGASRATGPEV
jgi:hypothetical protein